MYDNGDSNDLDRSDDDLSELRRHNLRIAEEAKAIIELSLDPDMEVVHLRVYAEDLDAIDEQTPFVQTGPDLLTDAVITALEMTCATATIEQLIDELVDQLLHSGEDLDSEHARLHLRAIALLPYLTGQAVDMAEVFEEGDADERTRRAAAWLRPELIGRPGPAFAAFSKQRSVTRADALEAGLVLLRWLEARQP